MKTTAVWCRRRLPVGKSARTVETCTQRKVEQGWEERFGSVREGAVERKLAFFSIVIKKTCVRGERAREKVDTSSACVW